MNVFIWLPQIRWETADKMYMPYCPNCKSNARVGPHCFRDNHAGRVIVGLTETYYTVGMRHICYECEEKHKKVKGNVEAYATEKDLTVKVDLAETKYTFMGWDQTSLPLLPLCPLTMRTTPTTAMLMKYLLRVGYHIITLSTNVNNTNTKYDTNMGAQANNYDFVIPIHKC